MKNQKSGKNMLKICCGLTDRAETAEIGKTWYLEKKPLLYGGDIKQELKR